MLNLDHWVKEGEELAGEKLSDLLRKVPVVDPASVRMHKEPFAPYDYLFSFEIDGKPYTLIGEYKSSGQPKAVRAALQMLSTAQVDRQIVGHPVVMAPYLSSEARAVCDEAGAGYFDLEGNCRLSFANVYIERSVPTRPVLQRRDLKSLFTPKSACLLRLMLRDPAQQWRTTELSEQSGVSVGHVSNVRHALLDKEWAQVGKRGLFLSRPDALLDAWRDAYKPPAGETQRFYTPLHGDTLQNALKDISDPGLQQALDNVPMQLAWTGGSVMLASYSAAQWQAPYARNSTQYFFADKKGLYALAGHLKLAPAAKGENVVVTLVEDPLLFHDAVPIHPQAFLLCTSPVQTYLDLWVSGERGREAAEHLRSELFKWKK